MIVGAFFIQALTDCCQRLAKVASLFWYNVEFSFGGRVLEEESLNKSFATTAAFSRVYTCCYRFCCFFPIYFLILVIVPKIHSTHWGLITFLRSLCFSLPISSRFYFGRKSGGFNKTFKNICDTIADNHVFQFVPGLGLRKKGTEI